MSSPELHPLHSVEQQGEKYGCGKEEISTSQTDVEEGLVHTP